MDKDRQQLLRIRDVTALTGLHRATLYKLMALGEFPAPVRLTQRARAWRSNEIQDWIDERQPAR